MENWRRFLNEAFVSGDPSEVYEKIEAWAGLGNKTLGVGGVSAEQLGLKAPPSGQTTQQHVEQMLIKLKDKLDKIESLGGITIHYKEVSPGDLFPYFNVETEGPESEELQETGNSIRLVYNPDDQTAKVTFKETDFDDLPEIDPTTGDVKGVEPREDDER